MYTIKKSLRLSLALSSLLLAQCCCCILPIRWQVSDRATADVQRITEARQTVEHLAAYAAESTLSAWERLDRKLEALLR